MTEHPEVTVLMTAKTAFDAQVVVGILREAGIPAYVGGALLTDPVAVSELLANTRQVDIKVPVDRVAEARDAVRSADAASHLLDDPSFDPGPRPDDV